VVAGTDGGDPGRRGWTRWPNCYLVLSTGPSVAIWLNERPAVAGRCCRSDWRLKSKKMTQSSINKETVFLRVQRALQWQRMGRVMSADSAFVSPAEADLSRERRHGQSRRGTHGGIWRHGPRRTTACVGRRQSMTTHRGVIQSGPAILTKIDVVMWIL